MKLLYICFFIVSVLTSIPCQVCHQVISFISHAPPQRLSYQLLDRIAIIYCNHKVDQDRTVCRGAITQMTPSIINSIWRHYTDPHMVCFRIKLCSREYFIRNLTSQIQSIIKDKPDKHWEAPTKRKTLKILHISDLHPDLFYTPGAQVKCSEPVCCRSNVSLSHSPQSLFEKYMKNQTIIQQNPSVTQAAGYWGSKGLCDLPIQTFDIFLQEISKIDLNAIIWTGDNTPHDVWAQTQSYNLNFTIMLAEKISNATGAIVLPAMGNHESWPVNVYDFQGAREQMLNGGLAQAWRKWLSEEAYNTLRTKGYYSMTHPSLNNLKVIGINTQAGNDMNWYLLRDPTDPGKMLVWIENQLAEAQKANQFVYLIGHIPPNDNLNDWSMRYNALVDRYSYIIRGQFFGHTHSDHLSFFPKIKEHLNQKKIRSDPLSNYYLVAPSLTTYSDRMPSYRVMQVDFDTLQVIDFHQYKLDLSKYKTKDQSPKFQLLYSFLSAYQLEDMTVEGGMTEFRNKLRDNKDIQILFTHYKSGGESKGSSGIGVFCDTMSSPLYHSECIGQTKVKTPSFEKVAGPWKDLKKH